MQISCPGCKTRLQLPDSTPGGSKIQCPSCKKVMVLPATAGAKPAKPAAAKAPPPVTTKAPATATKPPVDDEEGGLYGVVKDPDDEEEVEEEEEEEEEETPRSSKEKKKKPAKPKSRKPEINYAPDTSIKDLRGPAMIQVVTPSNYMMIQCGIVMLTAVFSIGIALWPFMFQDRILVPSAALRDYYREQMAKPGQEGKSAGERWKKIDMGYISWPKAKKNKDDDQGWSGEEMKEEEVRAAEEAIKKQMPFAVAWLVVSVLILAYAVTVAFGAVKMQSLESYPWALTGAILAMIPFNGIALLVYYFKPMNFSEDMPYILLALAIEGIFFFLIGVLCLVILLKKEVKTGFYYRTDAVG